MFIVIAITLFLSCSPYQASPFLQVYFFILTLKHSWQSVGRCDITPPTSIVGCWCTVTHMHTHTKKTPHTPDGVLSTPCFSKKTKTYHLLKWNYSVLQCLGCHSIMIFFSKKWMFSLRTSFICKLVFKLVTLNSCLTVCRQYEDKLFLSSHFFAQYYSIVIARLIGIQYKRRWCHFSMAITLCNQNWYV